MQTLRSKNKEEILKYLRKIAQKEGIDPKLLIDFETNTPTPLGYIIYRKRKLTYLKYSPGQIIIRKENGKSLFDEPIVQLYHEYLENIWKPRKVDIIIGLPCTRVKPYSKSITHKMMNHYVDEIRKKCDLDIEVISISEPMLIVPQKYETLFPLSNYDFPPDLMDESEKKTMVYKLAILLPKLFKAAKYEILFILPQHHFQIVNKAVKIVYKKHRNDCKYKYHNRVKMVKYGKLAFKTLNKVYKYIKEKYCSNNCS